MNFDVDDLDKVKTVRLLDLTTATFHILNNTFNKVGGSEYGGNEGVVELAATIGSTADPVPSFALGRAMVVAGHGVR
ncbi:hypothetical protein BY996DRAFT_6465341 [Phakopsora pachyrhizi]|nr:hypothetical protein BY996DRAFT_6465341 [Phakopsora pachyrhizi]